jgi:hypothetical protein
MTVGQKKTYLILGAVTVTTIVATGITIGVVISKRKRAEEFNKLLVIIEKGNAGNTGGKGSAWDTSLYTNSPSSKTINFSVLQQFAKTIYDAKGNTYDDEQKVIGIFNQLQNAYDVSALSFAFFKAYGEDLYIYLASFMDNSDHWGWGVDKTDWMAKIIERVKQIS